MTGINVNHFVIAEVAHKTTKITNCITKCLGYLALVFLLHGQPVGRLALPEAAAVVWEAASTVPDPSMWQHSNTEPASQ